MNCRKYLVAMASAMLALGPLSSAEPIASAKAENNRLQNAGKVMHEILGIPDDIPQDLINKARCVIVMPSVLKAAFVFGGKRHLALAASLITGSSRPWPSPFADALPQIMALRGEVVCVLASGDPFMHGIVSVLGRHIPVAEMIVVPAPSAFSLAAARLCWSLPETVLLSLHGRPLDLIRPYLQPGARLLVLTSGSDAPAALTA